MTRTPRYGCGSEPKVQEDTARKQFIAWLDTICANLDPRVKHRALLASKEAAFTIIAEAQWESKEQTKTLDQTRCVDRPKSTHGHSTIKAEYRVKTGTSELPGNVRTRASKTAMTQVVDRTSWISFNLIKVPST